MKTTSYALTLVRHLGLSVCLLTLSVCAAHSRGHVPTDQPAKSIPFGQLGAEAQKQYSGDGIGITPTAGGARLRAAFQKLEGQATAEGLWLESTAEGNGQPEHFRVLAIAQGRAAAPPSAGLLPRTGTIQVARETALFVRSGLVEEYSVSMDGVRQDFVVLERPMGTGELKVTLEVTGAQVVAAPYGVKLTLRGSGREIAYSRLHVTDARSRQLPARFEVTGTQFLQVCVDDAEAAYPIRIDPTFSDADWISMGVTPGAGGIMAMVVDGSGNLYVGGFTSLAGGVPVNKIAKWDGNIWSPLGSGVNGAVRALTALGTDIYVGGDFTSAGGIANTRRIAKWNGTEWSSLGSGFGSFSSVYALAASGSDLYVGGSFENAGGVSANSIAKWNGTTWSALGTGLLNAEVLALAISGTNIYAGGRFTSAGGVSVSNIAKWNGTTWSAMGNGISGGLDMVTSLVVAGTDLYVGGDFTTAGGVSAKSVAKWNGSSWSSLGSGISDTGAIGVRLVVSGTDLYAGGYFTTVGGVVAKGIAKWNGSSWSPVSSGVEGGVDVMVAIGSDIYIAGGFNAVGEIGMETWCNGIIKWNGSAWSPLGSGIDGSVHALAGV